MKVFWEKVSWRSEGEGSATTGTARKADERDSATAEMVCRAGDECSGVAAGRGISLVWVRYLSHFYFH